MYSSSILFTFSSVGIIMHFCSCFCAYMKILIIILLCSLQFISWLYCTLIFSLRILTHQTLKLWFLQISIKLSNAQKKYNLIYNASCLYSIVSIVLYFSQFLYWNMNCCAGRVSVTINLWYKMTPHWQLPPNKVELLVRRHCWRHGFKIVTAT